MSEDDLVKRLARIEVALLGVHDDTALLLESADVLLQLGLVPPPLTSRGRPEDHSSGRGLAERRFQAVKA